MRSNTMKVLAAVAAFATLVPLIDSPAEAGSRARRNAGIAAGIIVGVAAAAAIANANTRRSYRRNDWRARCNRWLRECDRGINYSCEKFETRGCTE